MSKSVVKFKNNNKNKLNSEIILIFNLNPNVHLESLYGEMIKNFGLPSAIPPKTSLILKWD